MFLVSVALTKMTYAHSQHLFMPLINWTLTLCKLKTTTTIDSWPHVVTLVWNFSDLQPISRRCRVTSCRGFKAFCQLQPQFNSILSMLVQQSIWLHFSAHVFNEAHGPIFCTGWGPWCCIIICGWCQIWLRYDRYFCGIFYILVASIAIN